ncbi:hypothetical protein [Streptomyces sp. NPDC002172]
MREIDEELQAAIDPGSMVHFVTFESARAIWITAPSGCSVTPPVTAVN